MSRKNDTQNCDLYWERMGVAVNWTAMTERGRIFLGGTMSHSVDANNHSDLLKQAETEGLTVVEFDPWDDLKSSLGAE